MPFNDGIDRVYCYSLTDFHTFDYCPFRFLVRHHLEKKDEIDDSNPQMALGTLLDESIKLFHKSKSYGQPPEYLENIVKAAALNIKEHVAQKGIKSFYFKHGPFIDAQLIAKATNIFKNYYLGLNQNIKKSLEPVGFCEWVIKNDSGRLFKLWGGPDVIEMGDDGIPEVTDYKSRENIETGKENIDMDLMPKIYTLLCSKKLLDLGYKKARFVVRFWQDPTDDSFKEEFDLEKVSQFEDLFREKIEKILSISGISFCEKNFCRACKSEKRQEYIKELEAKKFIQPDPDLLFAPF